MSPTDDADDAPDAADARPPARLTNLTVKVDQEVLLYARWRALREGTSVNAAVVSFLEEYAGRTGDAEPKRRRSPRA